MVHQVGAVCVLVYVMRLAISVPIAMWHGTCLASNKCAGSKSKAGYPGGMGGPFVFALGQNNFYTELAKVRY